MSDPLPTPPAAPTPAPPPAANWGRTLLLSLALAAVAGGVYAVVYWQNQDVPKLDVGKQLQAFLDNQAKNATLAAEFADGDQDMVADAPKDKFLTPAEIAFTGIAADDPADAEKRWKPLMDALAKATGKKVTYLSALPAAKDADPESAPPAVRSGEQQMAAVRAGQLHVTAFNTGLVPAAVNTAGFVPMFCPAGPDGKFTYQMEVIVPASSPVKDLKDLKGQTVGLVAMSSNSGGKAPLVALKEQAGLLPGRDYELTFTGSHAESIRLVADGKLAAAAVAGDLLARLAAEGKVDKGKYRSVYVAPQPFPPLCFGVPHALDPALKAAVAKAFADPAAGTFAAVKYAADWQAVREIDAKLKTLLDAK